MTAAERASDEIRNAVRRVVTAEGGRMVKRRMYRARPDLDWEQEEPEPLAAIAAAVALRNASTIAFSRAARQAREDGHDWETIGVTAGYERNPENGDTPGITVFYHLAGRGVPGHSPTFAWTCPACLKTIIDKGPYAGHPADMEAGHTADCTRLAGTIRTYEERTAE